MRNLFHQSRNGFSLIEILVAVSVIAIILVASLGMTTRYVANARFDRLMIKLERAFLDANTYALAGYSKAFAKAGGTDVTQVPERYHLYIEKRPTGPDASQTSVWYLESKVQSTSQTGEQLQVIYSELSDFEADPLRIADDGLVFFQNDLGTGTPLSADWILITWQVPFAQLSFQKLSAPLSISTVPATISLSVPSPSDPVKCDVASQQDCYLHITYERPGTDLKRTMVIGKNKSVWKEG